MQSRPFTDKHFRVGVRAIFPRLFAQLFIFPPFGRTYIVQQRNSANFLFPEIDFIGMRKSDIFYIIAICTVVPICSRVSFVRI